MHHDQSREITQSLDMTLARKDFHRFFIEWSCGDDRGDHGCHSSDGEGDLDHGSDG